MVISLIKQDVCVIMVLMHVVEWFASTVFLTRFPEHSRYSTILYSYQYRSMYHTTVQHYMFLLYQM
jgi:hypothetical protein